MRYHQSCFAFLSLCALGLLCSCSTNPVSSNATPPPGVMINKKPVQQAAAPDYSSRIPSHIAAKEKVIIIDPNVHVWGAYQNGELIKSGLAVAGADWCPDIGRRCHTRSGSFRVASLGSASCKSHIYPLPRGGAPMPYCMFFNGNQGMHGSYPSSLAEANLSHGCVRMRISDAEWIRYNFANIGTRVIVKAY